MPERSGSNISFLDTSFNQENTRSYILSLQISHFRISCFIYDAKSNFYLGFVKREFTKQADEKQVVDEIKQLMDNFEWLKGPFERVLVLVQNPLNTLIPISFFDKSQSTTYLEFVQAIGDDAHIKDDLLKNNEAVNVYALSKLFHDELASLFPGAVFKHFSTVFIETISINYKNLMDNNSVYMNIREDSFDLLYFADKRLRFYNLFKYKTKEDLIYFLLAALEELSLNPEDINLYLMGFIEKGDRLHEIIYRYVRNSTFIGKNETYSYAAVMGQEESHKLFVLYNLPQCV